MLTKRLDKLWQQLQGAKPHMPHFLSEIRLSGVRGIHGLRVQFDYPVSVVAGGNASGKSTLLFAAACAYQVPGAGPKDYVPSTLFPNYQPKQNGRRDERNEISLAYEYSIPDGRMSMLWRRKKGWNRSFFGLKGGQQPRRPLYLRTLSNLSNPSEVRGVLSLSRTKTPPTEEALNAEQIDFAQQLLPFRYNEVVRLSDKDQSDKNLLFAALTGGTAYSEFHMAAGERVILRLAREVTKLDGALVLIDEVETGLHPWVQQLLMLQLQQLALRNNLQIIVTSHSPVVLDSVPEHARIFLERDERGNVAVLPPYRDIIQDALYGRSHAVLNWLCEDEAAEGILCGVVDYLAPRQQLRRESIRIGRDTGASEFAGHAVAFKKFGLTSNFVFVLDGDQRKTGVAEKVSTATMDNIPVYFLPGEGAPEEWAWDVLARAPKSWAGHLHMDADVLTSTIERLNAVYDNASDKKADIAKTKLNNLSESLGTTSPALCRLVARVQAADSRSDIRLLVNQLEDAVLKWRRE